MSKVSFRGVYFLLLLKNMRGGELFFGIVYYLLSEWINFWRNFNS